MKLREIIRPQQLDEFGLKDIKSSLGQANSAAEKWWEARWPKIRIALGVAGTAMIVYDVYDTIQKSIDIDCKGMPDHECDAAIRAMWARLAAHYGAGYVLFVAGAYIGGLVGGPAAWATAPVGGIIAFLVAEGIWGDDIDSAVNWIVKKLSGMDTNRPMAYPQEKRKSTAEPYKGNPKQQAYRQGQVGMDTANNPNPRLHPDRYPQD